MSPFPIFWLSVYTVAFVAVVFVRGRAARVVRRAGEPRPGAPTGAELGRQLLDERGMGVIRVVEADADAYRAVHGEIQLADGRFDQASPAAWAVVALEVAHAAQHEAGSPTWRRWWVLSGHTVWAGPLLFVLLLVQLIVTSPILVLASLVCIGILGTSWALSVRVEQRAVFEAREMLDDALRGIDGAHEVELPLRWAARAYTAESVFDLGALDRAVDPYRASPGMGPDG